MLNKRLTKAFLKFKKENPYLGDIIILNNVVVDKDYGRMEIGQVFDRLVDKDDYDPADRDEILAHTYSLISRRLSK